MITIGPYQLSSNIVLAPMAGVTDLPFRRVCRKLGAGLTPSEMISSNPRLRDSNKSSLRRVHDAEECPRVVQIAGYDPEQMAEAAVFNVAEGAQIIDINMGCPAKKVLKKAAGSALLKDEKLVRNILESVVNAVDIPVTLKIRTGWDRLNRNGAVIACIAEAAGIQALAVHGRTRECLFRGTAEYDTIRAIKQSVSIPVFANGDIDSPRKAGQVMAHTGADGIMIGRAAQGNPWLFREIAHYFSTGKVLPGPDNQEIKATIIDHLEDLYAFYGEYRAVRIARKHIGWYLKKLTGASPFIPDFNQLDSRDEQLTWLDQLFVRIATEDIAA